MKDERLSSAIHLLIMVSEARVPMSSEQIALSVGTNPARIRKLASSLRRAGIIESRQGAKGFKLTRAPEEVDLLEVFQAVHEGETIEVFDLHRNPSDACVVGRHIRPALSGLFDSVSLAVSRELQAITLSDCISSLAREIETSEGTEAIGEEHRVGGLFHRHG